ncbi:hypothetical protein NDU88_003235 [Pleurodeles waltl]|uniref:Peptidase C1A papain C-terminal domain-containing protein n=1 Tax=Pleurodeles waltl TaxID=8319 RepID=A0AAV7RDR4_PLEWA|nr:hypothetical protein NDU88_003235 [Pleurodeles waltl]
MCRSRDGARVGTALRPSTFTCTGLAHVCHWARSARVTPMLVVRSPMCAHVLVSHACYPFDGHGDNKPVSCYLRSAYNHYEKRYAIDQCPNKVEKSNHVYQCSPPYRVPSNESEIMKEIMDNGPVQAVMQVHEDFFLYKTGIYRHTDATIDKPEQYRICGTHSVKITGWGAVKGPTGEKQKFWIVANSWGKSWGENGHFRIIRGENECGIETVIIGAWCHVMRLE